MISSTSQSVTPFQPWIGVARKLNLWADDRLEIVLNQPRFDQRRLRERTPDLFRRMRHHPFDDEATRGGNNFRH